MILLWDKLVDTEYDQLVTSIKALAQLPLNRGRTLPREAYLSEALHRHEIDNLFQRQWICIGRSAQIPDPGDYLTFELVGHPLVAVRQKDGQILTFANICLHRCAQLLNRSQGHAGRISCPYTTRGGEARRRRDPRAEWRRDPRAEWGP